MVYNEMSVYVLHKQINCKGLRKFRWPFAWLIQWMAHQSGHPKDLPNPNHTAGLYIYGGRAYVFESLGKGVVHRKYLSFLEASKKENAEVWLEEAFDTTQEQIINLINEINRLLKEKSKYDIKKAIKTVLEHEYNTPLSNLLKEIISLVLGKTKDSEINFFCTEVFQWITKIAYHGPRVLKKADIATVDDYPHPKTAQPHRLLGFFCKDKNKNINVREALRKNDIIKLNLEEEIRQQKYE